MELTIRKAVAADAPAWVELLRVVTENGYPDQQAYDPPVVATQLEQAHSETWIAEAGGVIHAALSFLPPGSEPTNPVANIGRHLHRPEAYQNGAAAALLAKAVEVAQSREQLVVSRVLASDSPQHLLYEQAGFAPVGFQPHKHAPIRPPAEAEGGQQRSRESVIFYYRLGGVDLGARLPISESIPQVAELAQLALGSLNLGIPAVGRDGLTGYPLQGEVEFIEGGRDEFELWRAHAQSIAAPIEISGGFNHGVGFLRAASGEPPAAVFAVQNGTVGAGVLCTLDPLDHCLRVLNSFAVDDYSLGPLLSELTKRTLQEAGAYVELDILASAPRLLKTAEQIGFVPVAYFPALYSKAGSYADVIKLVKLNAHYSPEDAALTPAAKRVADVITQNFEDQKIGLAIINLLRGLPFFHGLGDGELRKIARLFTQKMFRAGETVFKKGEYSYDAYVVMRGQVDIVLNEGGPPLAQIGNGEIFGELAFLDATPRSASALANQTTIALVIQRTAFNDLARREPHLGMVVMRNIALELSKRLRKSNEALPRGG